MAGVLPGGTVRRDRFVAALRAVQTKHEYRIRDVLEDIGNETIAHLRAITPKDTGAAAGDATGVPLYKSHPAFKLNLVIGNEVGESGWQMVKSKDRTKTRFAIINPMWNHYLKYVNYGHGANNNFVETAARQMRESLKEMR